MRDPLRLLDVLLTVQDIIILSGTTIISSRTPVFLPR